MSLLSPVPAGFQSRYFREIEGDSIPEIYLADGKLYIPVFAREIVREDATLYAYFVAVIPYKGQNYSDYVTCLKQCYSEIRGFFYADFAAQSEMRDDATWEAHRQAVRSAFPKYDGEVNEQQARFEAIKESFWETVDAALAEIHKTRSDLPDFFTAETMLQFAVENEMSSESIARYAQAFSTLSLDLLHNDRNWKELFV